MKTPSSDSEYRIAELERQRQAILEEIGRLRGATVNPRVEMPLKSDDPEIEHLTARYMSLAGEIETLRNRAENERLTRFKRAINGADDPDIRRWWLNRY